MPQAPVTREQYHEAVEAFEKANGNQSVAAEILGLPRPTFRNRLLRGSDLYGDKENTPSFSVPELPSADEPIDELLARLRKQSVRSIEADRARKLIPVKLTIPGPIGLFLQGDPHLDNPGCDFNAVERDLELVQRQPRVLSICIGDVLDNWIGRLERLNAHSSVTAKDGWRLAEWMFRQPVNWLALSGGNHDAWSGTRDPLAYIARHRVPLYEKAAARIALHHPNGAVTRAHARHDFPGRSMYSETHRHVRAVREGPRDHLVVAGHLHSGEERAIINGDGFVTQCVSLSGYKVVDSFAKELGFQPKPMHPSAFVVIDPDAPETSRRRVWCAPDIETGVDYLNFIAKRAVA